MHLINMVCGCSLKLCGVSDVQRIAGESCSVDHKLLSDYQIKGIQWLQPLDEVLDAAMIEADLLLEAGAVTWQ